jgi:hypothetical protein
MALSSVPERKYIGVESAPDLCIAITAMKKTVERVKP